MGDLFTTKKSKVELLTVVGTVTVLLVFAVGCDAPLGYEVVVRNTGSRDVDAVRLSFGKFVDEPGVLSAGSHSGHMDVREPLPTEAVVEWRDMNGGAHRAVLKVMPRSEFRGVLVFEINDQEHVAVMTEVPPSAGNY